MAAPRATTSRVSLDDWDSLAPLSAKETKHVNKLTASDHVRPVPAHLQIQAASPSRPTTPNAGGLYRKASRLDLLHSPSQSPRPQSAASLRPPGYINGSIPPPQEASLLDIREPIQTTQQFHDWYSQVEQSLEREQEDIYRQHLSSLHDYISSCDLILSQLDDSRGLLSEMEANYRFVEDNSRALQLACETMLEEQKHLIEVTEAIAARLEYFRELERCTRMLNSPGEELVLQEDYLNMLDRLDASLEYLRANRDFKDAEIYIIRFQQCLTRAMTLIKMYFVSTIKRTTSEVQEKMSGKELSETALQALIYTKFQSTSEPLRILIFELEKRVKQDAEEYSNLLNECFSAWFASRSALIGSALSEEVRRMEPEKSDLIKLARAGCNHLRSVALSEWSLYKTLFSSGERQLYSFLESLCDNLYDSLRPRILHEPKLEVLCELCTVLNAMMALDDVQTSTSTDSDDEFDPETDATDFTDDNTGNGSSALVGGAGEARSTVLGRLRFSLLLQSILQDSQTRLVFRAQAVVQSEVLYHVPTEKEIDYPAILEKEGGGLRLWTEEEGVGGEPGGFRAPREEVMKSWFPTLRRTIWVLGKLSSYVNNTIFEDFAGEAVTLCRQSLSNASTAVANRSGNTKIDGQLFLIRHLLLLKEMIRSVDLVHIERAADFSTVTDALVGLLRNTSVIFRPNALFELASRGIPSFVETMTDAKTDLDTSLKKTCEELISDSSSLIALPIRSFLDKCTAYLSAPGGNKDLSSQSWASPEGVIKLHEEFTKGLEQQTGDVVGKLRVYLSDEKTIGVLLPPLLDEIVETYTTFYNLTRSEYGFATSSSLQTPSAIKDRLVAIR